MVNAKCFADRSLKVFLCLVVLFGFLFVQPREKIQQVDAALPLLAWVAPVLGNILIDTALDMGLEFVDDAAKTKWKDKKVADLWNKYGDRLKDLVPTKKNLKEWSLKAPKWLMAAVVDTVTDTIEDTVKSDSERKEKNKSIKYTSDVDLETTDPFYNTSLNLSGFTILEGTTKDLELLGYFNEWLNYKISPVSYNQKSKMVVSVDSDFGDDSDVSLYFIGGYDGPLRVASNSDAGNVRLFSGSQAAISLSEGSSFSKYVDVSGYGVNTGIFSAYPAYKKYLQRLEETASKTYYSDGVISSDGFDSYFDLPDDDDEGNPIVYSPDVLEKLDDSKYPMIREKEFNFNFGDDSNIIDADFEVINEGDDIEWEIIERDISNNNNNYNKTLNYDYEPTVNNLYEVSKKEDIENDINVIVKNEIEVGGGGNWSAEIEIDGPFYCVDKSSRLPTSCKEVEAIDGSLLDYVSNAYEYAVNAVKSGVDGLNTIVTGSVGLIALYSNIFDWLPSEMKVILTSGLLLMIGLRVFRK